MGEHLQVGNRNNEEVLLRMASDVEQKATQFLGKVKLKPNKTMIGCMHDPI